MLFLWIVLGDVIVRGSKEGELHVNGTWAAFDIEDRHIWPKSRHTLQCRIHGQEPYMAQTLVRWQIPDVHPTRLRLFQYLAQRVGTMVAQSEDWQGWSS